MHTNLNFISLTLNVVHQCKLEIRTFIQIEKEDEYKKNVEFDFL